eukprot:14024311-Ditylum_brightwellii.AAC.1
MSETRRRGGITQIEVPEWDKCKFVMILGLGTILGKAPQELQWWCTMYYYIIVQAFTDRKNYMIDL